MASITLTTTRECAAMNHIHLAVTGATEYQYDGTMEDIMSPITDEEKDAFIKVLLRLGKVGRTNGQVRQALAAGFTITI